MSSPSVSQLLKESLIKLYTSSKTLKKDFLGRNYDYLMNQRDTPGSRARDIRKEDIPLMKEEHHNWVVCPKTDGTRMLLFGFEGNTYLIDRAYNFKKIDIKIPNNTLLDGEYVESRNIMLIFDVIFWNNLDAGSITNLKKRIELVERLFYKIDNSNANDCTIKFKTFYDLKDIKSLINPEIITESEYVSDGLLFTQIENSYYHVFAFKLKPDHHKTADFVINMSEIHNENINIMTGFLPSKNIRNPKFMFYSTIKTTEKMIKDLENYKEPYIVIECNMPDKKSWSYVKTRPDKQKSNSFTGIQSIVYDIMHPVSIDYILTEFTIIE